MGWGTASSLNEFKRATLKLTAYYVVSTFVILAISSFAIIALFVPPDMGHDLFSSSLEIENGHSEWSLYELRQHLVLVVLVVDVAVLFLVSFISYFFARNTLRPIKDNQDRQLKFMGDVAHELRTPLAVMLAGGEIMLKQNRSLEEYKDYITDVQEESKRLTHLSNQLLQLLRVNSNSTLESSPCDFSALCRNEIRKFQAYAEEKNVQLVDQISESIQIKAHSDSIVRLLQNLIKNAIDYTNQGGNVIVSLTVKESLANLMVTDTGVGIPQAMQTKIFERFQTLDTSHTNQSQVGVGLGLSIVKEIVAQHKGTIKLISREGVGTTVAVNLPLYRS